MELDQTIQNLDPDVLADFTDASMQPQQAYWVRVHMLAATLDPLAAAYDDAIRKTNVNHRHGFMEASTRVVYITSVKSPAKGIRPGRVFLAPPLLAAQRIADLTHRISTAEEVEAWQSEQRQRVREVEILAASKLPPQAPIIVNLPETSVTRETRRSESNRPAETKQ